MSQLDTHKVVVAMSGGVDSSVAAILLREQGFDVIGISMKTHESPEDSAPCDPEALSLPTLRHAAKSCCSVEDIMDARHVCQQLDIPFYAMNFKETFKSQVMDYFAGEYGRGRTPNPCVLCNDQLKFKALLTEAHRLGAYYLATGHYVRKLRDENGIWHIHQGEDTQKDQSYFLFGLGQEQLEHLIFPIGTLTKSEVRATARKHGIRTADKAESQEICFVPDNNYAGVLERVYPETIKPAGTFRLSDGRSVGTHRGSHAYTIGQRRGLHVATGERIYVTAIDSGRNEVTLGSDEDLYHGALGASRINWIRGRPQGSNIRVAAKIRYRQRPMPAWVRIEDGNCATVLFDEPQRAITPGQAVVFYQKDELIGGGWIEGHEEASRHSNTGM